MSTNHKGKPVQSESMADRASAGATAEDSRLRVLYGLMLPIARLGFLFGTSLKTVGELVQMASFHETRRRGLKSHESAQQLGVSIRKVALLSRQLKQNFLQAETEHELPRRLEYMLWAGPLSAPRLKQVLTDIDPNEVDTALESLQDQGRVRKIAGRTDRYEVVRSEYRLVSSDWLARLDGLNNLMASVGNVVYGRFFRGEHRSFARTVSLRIREQDFERLQALYERTIWPALVEFDDDARDADDTVDIDVSVLWAPYEYTQNISPNDDGDEP